MHFAAIALVALGFLFLRKRGSASASTAPRPSASAPLTPRDKAQAIAISDPTVYRGTTVTPVDDPHYPGWFRGSDGSWINPDTGEVYSAGSSPPRTFVPGIDNDAFKNIDLLAGPKIIPTDPYGVIF